MLPYHWMLLSTLSAGTSAYCATASLMRRLAWWGTNQSIWLQSSPVLASASFVARIPKSHGGSSAATARQGGKALTRSGKVHKTKVH